MRRMKPVIVGVISRNLCIRRDTLTSAYNCNSEEDEDSSKDLFVAFSNNNNTHHDKTNPRQKPISRSHARSPTPCDEPRVHRDKHTLLWERAVIVDGKLAACIGRTYSVDLIKNTMLKKYITSTKDKEIAAGITIPHGFVDRLSFPFSLRPITMSILPTLAFSGESTLVPWSIYTPSVLLQGQDEQQLIIQAPENMSYVDFLLWYASCHQARIDYSIFIYAQPLLLGQANLHLPRSTAGAAPNLSFFFARVLSCKEMLTHGLVVATHISPSRT
jgi:hypothetical protein